MINNFALKKYMELISQFISNDITLLQFNTRYLELFKQETVIFGGEIYETLNNLFLDIDQYCGDPNLWEEGDLNDEQLLESAKKSLIKLQQIYNDGQ